MKLKSYGDVLVVKRDPKKTTTDSGIFLPDQYGDGLSTGVVESGGDLLTDGTKILYNNTGAITMNGLDLIHKQSVLSRIEEE